MHRAAVSIAGVLLGALCGLLIGIGQPLGAFLDRTTVTWSGASCPPGVYTVTSTARSVDWTQFFSVTTRNVTLPQASVTQEFANLPPGVWTVTAMSSSGNGRTFYSPAQTIQVGGNVVGIRRGRPLSGVPIGWARPRNAPISPPAPKDPRSTAPSRIVVAPAPGPSTTEEVLRRALARVLAEPAGGDVRQFTVEDLDGDGTIDVVMVESTTGEVWIIRLRGGTGLQ